MKNVTSFQSEANLAAPNVLIIRSTRRLAWLGISLHRGDAIHCAEQTVDDLHRDSTRFGHIEARFRIVSIANTLGVAIDLTVELT